MSWYESASRNIIPLSISDNLGQAIKEWNYMGNIIEDSNCSATCQLCDHPKIKYQFQIVNRDNSNELYVGSECITKFGILGLSEDGTEINVDETKKQLVNHKAKFIKERNIKHVLECLILLGSKNEELEEVMSDFYRYYEERGAFTPNQLSMLFYQLNKQKIKYDKSCFKLVMKRDREKDQRKQMTSYKISTIWDSMSASQKKMVPREQA